MQPTSPARRRLLYSRSATLLCALLPTGCLWDALIDDPETTSSADTSSTSNLPTTGSPTSGTTSPEMTTNTDSSSDTSTGALSSGVDTGTTEAQTSTSGETSSTSETSETPESSSTTDTTTGGPVCDQAPGAPGSTIAVVRMHGLGVQSAQDVAIDASGNIYVVGNFTNQLLIDDKAQPEQKPVIGQPVAAPFISKFACDGTHEWTQVGTTDGTSSAKSLVISDSQDVFITGSFTKTLTFPGVPPLDPNVSSTVFVAKVDPTGDFLDTSTLALEATVGNAIARDANDNLYITGGCSTGDKPGILMAKLTKDLGTTALKCLPGGSATSAALAGDGLIVGGTMNTDLLQLSTCNPVNKAADTAQDGFVAKVALDLSNTATGTWCKSIASTFSETINDLAVSGNTVTAVGKSVSPSVALMGCGNPAVPAGAIAVPIDLKTGLCDPATNLLVGKSNELYGIDASGQGNRYIAGQFADTLKDLNAGAGAVTFFVAKDLNLAWAKQTVPHNGMPSPQSHGKAIAVTDRVAVVGYTGGGPGEVDYDGLTAANENDAFLLVLWP